MKKAVCFLVLFALLCLILYAEDNNNRSGVFDIGAGYTYTSNPEFKGGHLELGINLYRKTMYIQNRLLLRAGGHKIDDFDGTILTLSEKLVFGPRLDDVGFYIYIEGGAGFYGNPEKDFFSGDALVYSFGFGGGLGLGGIYIETGYLAQKITPVHPLSGIVIQTGYRIYL